MTVVEGLLQGIVQGVTEFLPVSSSGHLSLFQHLFGLQSSGSLFFSLMLHVGTLLAVFVAFWPTIRAMIAEFFKMLADIFKGKFKFSECNEERRMVIMMIISLLPLLVFYFAKDYVEILSQDGDIIVEGICFLFTGTMLLIADRCVPGNATAVNMKPTHALIIGIFQGIAILPGVSRSGSTISSGMILGFSREFMVKFSFILGIPVIIASSLSEAKTAIETGIDVNIAPLIAGVLAAAVVGYLAIKLVRWLVTTDRFGIFGYYALALGTVVTIAGILESVYGQNIVTLIKGLIG